jgi:acetyltransferase-like isoleucine patch superfamily enzyme/acyl carrier protein
MVKLLSRIVSAIFYIGKSKVEKKGLRMRFESRLYVKAMRRKAKSIGIGTYVYGPGVNVTPYTTIGDFTGWGKNVKIYGDGEVTVGNFTAIAEDTVIYTQNHDYDHDERLPFGPKYIYKPVRIDDYAWVGLRCILLPGAHIGEGAVIQAGSVVQGEIPPCAIAGGNPARVFAMRDVEHYNKLKVAAGGKPVEIKGGCKAGSCACGRRCGTASPAGTGVPPARDAAPVEDAAAKYANIFAETFALPPAEVGGLKYQEFPAWDSAGQMTLIGRIEETFGVAFDADDIYAFRSFADGREILEKKHGIKF